MIKVLLISPKDPKAPTKFKYLMGGENTFTQSLLDNPPPGISYTHYLKENLEGLNRAISYTFWQKSLSALIKLQILPPDVGFQAIKLNYDFDLIHCHSYCLKIESKKTPVVLSDSSSNFLFLRDYLGWSKRRIGVHYFLRKKIHRLLGIYDPNLNLKNIKKLIVWSEFAKKIHVSLGTDPQKIVVIPPGIEGVTTQPKKDPNFLHILFIGTWFERKGGLLLVEAYRILKEKYPFLRLNLVGEVPKTLSLPKDTWCQPFVSRKKILTELYPRADIFVLAPPVAEGYGIVVLEAASAGVPAIVSNVYALPEIVEDKKTGFVIKPGSLDELVEKLEVLITNESLRKKMGEAAKKRFEEKFSIKVTNKKLLKVYQEATEG